MPFVNKYDAQKKYGKTQSMACACNATKIGGKWLLKQNTKCSAPAQIMA
eukprot:jgi/Antlo1/1422/1389